MDQDTPRFLLLLPPAPSAGDDELIGGVYGETIREVLQEVALASQECRKAAILELALACPHFIGKQGPDFSRYDATQEVVARIYRLVCKISARYRINVEDKDGVDVRVLLVAWNGDLSATPIPKCQIPTLQDFVISGRQWQYAFGVESDAGEAMVRAFVEAKQAAVDRSAPPRLDKSRVDPKTAPISGVPCVAVGGTFDHLHIGHKLLLTMTWFAALDKNVNTETNRTVIVGVTGDELLKNKKYAEHLEGWHERRKIVEQFVASIADFTPGSATPSASVEVREPGANGHAVNTAYANDLFLRCVEIGDPFGPTITEADIDALIISAETRAGGKAVNDKRTEQDWKPLKVLEVDVLEADDPTNTKASDATSPDDFAGKISSTAIRQKLNSKGHQSVL